MSNLWYLLRSLCGKQGRTPCLARTGSLINDEISVCYLSGHEGPIQYWDVEADGEMRQVQTLGIEKRYEAIAVRVYSDSGG